ncbi:MAG: DNA-binding response regulator [Bacteroidetes bacterium]|nr:MAG: DNA-binding response regulator [Bacteroidota bacterium]
MNVLIIEDEDLAAKRLTRLLGQLAPEARVLATLDSVQGAVAWLQAQRADLIFLDIHLADGNSFAIFDQVELHTPIIFVTAYDQYALRAFRHNSLDYLLKPVEEEELARALAKFRASRIPATLDLQALMAAMQPPAAPPRYQQRFLVATGDKIRSIPVGEVAYFFGQQKFVFLITQDGRQHIVDYTLTQLEDLLDPQHFFRINRQFIISYGAIDQMYPYSKSRIRVELSPVSDLEAVVSIEKTPRFKEWLNR